MHAAQQAELEQPAGHLSRTDQRADGHRSRQRRAACLQQAGRCAAIAVLMNQVAANTKASSEPRPASGAAAVGVGSARRSATPTWPSALTAAWAARQFNGSPTTQVQRRPGQAGAAPADCASSQADSGQPTVLAKPAISVMPVMALRESWP